MDAGELDGVMLFPDREIEVDFDIGGHRLVPGVRGEAGRPLEAFLELYAARGGRALARIASLEDLSRITLAVRDEAGARQFVGLPTSPATFYFFQKQRATIDLAVVADSEPPRPGTLPRSTARRLHLAPDLAEREGDGFHVARTLVRSESLAGPRQLLRRRERVASNGAYALLGEEIVGQVAAEDILMPYGE
jgi:hypothetical protein